MNELESQIAKIQLGNKKAATSYVYVMAEKAPVGESELFVVAEMSMLNPAAEESCERICMAIASTLKRSYRKLEQENSFENAIASINEELGKLTSMGQTQWINKLNCVLAVKSGNNFHISSCGKVSAFLLRNKEYTDISCSPIQTHPLKTFENYASGKIRLGDLLILSTTQLFNYLSMDRLLKIVNNSNFLTATKTIIEMLKEAAEPQIAFGVVLNLQVPIGQAEEETDDLENYIVKESSQTQNLLGGAIKYLKNIFALDKKVRTPKVDLPNISFSQRVKDIKGSTKNIVAKSGAWVQSATNSAKNLSGSFSAEKFKSLSKTKKYFFIAAAVLLVAVIINITIALNLKKVDTTKNETKSKLTEIQNLLLSAQSSVLYNNNKTAADFAKQAKEKFPEEGSIDESNKDLYAKLKEDLKNTEKQLEKIFEPQVTNLGSLGDSENLISLPNYLGTQINQTIITYNKQDGKIEDNLLNIPFLVLKTSYLSGNLVAVYDGRNIYSWNYSNGQVSQGYNEIVPQTEDFGGLASYSTNSRVYITDKKTASIISFLVSGSGLSKPVVSVRDEKLKDALDIAIDSSIYVLHKSGIYKFQSGKNVEFNTNELITPFSGTGKINTQKDFKYVYVLDSGNKRILILNKNGELVNTLKSEEFTNLKDFAVDEKNKIIYVLNNASLFKVALP